MQSMLSCPQDANRLFPAARLSTPCFIRKRKGHVRECRAQMTQGVRPCFVRAQTTPGENVGIDKEVTRRAEPGKLFDREKELAFLKRFATEEFRRGRLLLLGGPRNCGKSLLLSNLAQDKDVQNGVVLVNLRSGNASSPEGFFEIFRDALFASEPTGKLQKFFKTTLEGLEGVGMQDPKTGATAGMKVQKNSIQPHVNFQVVFETYLQKHPKKLITLVLDEANLLQSWLSDKVSQQTLITFLQFFVRITKEQRLANVVLVSSDFFLKFWLNEKIGSDRYSCQIVGDFTEADACGYFEYVLGKPCPDNTWNSIYGMLGGAPLPLRTIAESMLLDDDEVWKEGMLQLYYQTEEQTSMGLSPEAIEPLGVCPTWTGEEFVKVLTKMTEHKNGVVPWDLLVRSFGAKVLKALVCYNFIQYRTKSSLARDVTWYEGDWPIAMPISRLQWLAIKRIVAKSQGDGSGKFGWNEMMRLAGEDDLPGEGAGV